MRLSVPRLGNGLKTNRGLSFAAIIKQLTLIIVLAGLGYLGFLTYKHFHKTTPSSATHTSVEDFEKGTAGARQATLKAKDYQSYMIQHMLLESDYAASKKYDDAQRVMDELFANVPKNVINAAVYETMVGLEQAKGDNAKYKYYLGLLVEQLKREGDTKGAAGYQKLLDAAK